MTKRLVELVPNGRCLAVLEGGYDLRALADASAATMAALVGVEHLPEAPTCGGPGAPRAGRRGRALGRSAPGLTDSST